MGNSLVVSKKRAPHYLDNCKDLVLVGTTGAPPSGMKFRPVGHFPKYLDCDVPEIQSAPTEHESLFAARVSGWCQWPNLWNGDFVLCRGLRGMNLKKGRDYEHSQPLAGYELLAWKRFDGKLMVIKTGRFGLGIKRLLISEQRDTPRIMLACDNGRMQNPYIQLDNDDLECELKGVVEMIFPFNRDLAVLPDEMRDEYDRIYRPDGTRKIEPDRDGVEHPENAPVKCGYCNANVRAGGLSDHFKECDKALAQDKNGEFVCCLCSNRPKFTGRAAYLKHCATRTHGKAARA